MLGALLKSACAATLAVLVSHGMGQAFAPATRGLDVPGSPRRAAIEAPSATTGAAAAPRGPRPDTPSA